MSAFKMCRPCRRVIERAAESGRPFDPRAMCSRCCRFITEEHSKPIGGEVYSFLAEMPVFKQWAQRHGLAPTAAPEPMTPPPEAL